MSSGSPERDFHVQDPPPAIPGSLAYVLRQERSDSPLDESEIVERERIRRILRPTENSQNVSQSNLSYLEDISRTQESVPSSGDKTSSGEQSKVEDQSKQAGDSTETLSFPEDEKAEEERQEGQESSEKDQGESNKLKENIPKYSAKGTSAETMADILNELLQGMYIQSDKSQEEVIGIPEVSFVTIPGMGGIESKEDEMDIDEGIVYGDPLGSMRDAIDIQDPEEPSGRSVGSGKSTVLGESPSTLEKDTVDEIFEQRSDQKMLDLSNTSHAPEELSGGSENKLPDHSEQEIVQEDVLFPEKDTVDEIFQEGTDQQMLDLSNTSQAPEDPSGSSEYRLPEHLEQEIVQEDFLLPEKDTVDELFEGRSDQQMLDLSETSQAPEEPSGATGKVLHDHPEHSRQELSPSERDTLPFSVGNILDKLIDKPSDKPGKNTSKTIQTPPKEPGEKNSCDSMERIPEVPRAASSSSGTIPKTPRPGGSSEQASGKTTMGEILEKLINGNEDSRTEDPAASEEDTVDRLFNEDSEMPTGDTPGNVQSSEGLPEELSDLVESFRNSKTLSSSSGTIPKIQSEKVAPKPGGSSEESSGKTWMNMSDFMKMYKKKHGNAPQKNYTSQEEFLEDLKKLAKCLKIREGSKLKPEKFFRGLLPEYPAEPGYLERKYGGALKSSKGGSGKFPEDDRDEDSRAEGPEATVEDTANRLCHEDSEMQTGGTPGNVQSSEGLPEELSDPVESFRNAPNASMGEILEEIIDRDEDSKTSEDTVDRLFNEDSEMQSGGTPGNVKSSEGLPEKPVKLVRSVRNAPNASMGEILEELFNRDEDSKTSENTTNRLFNKDSEMQSGDTQDNVQSSEGLPEQLTDPIESFRNAPNATIEGISEKVIERDEDSRTEDPEDSEEVTVDRLFNENSEMPTGDTPGNVQSSERLPEKLVKLVRSVRNAPNASMGEILEKLINRDEDSRAEGSAASEEDTVDRLFNEDSEMQTGDTPGNVQSSERLPEELSDPVESFRNAPNASIGGIPEEVLDRDEDSKTSEDTVDRLFNKDSEMQTGDTPGPPGNVQSSERLPEEISDPVETFRNTPNATMGEILEKLINRDEDSRTEDPGDSEEDTVDRLFNEDSEMQTGDIPGNVQSSEGLPEELSDPVESFRNSKTGSSSSGTIPKIQSEKVALKPGGSSEESSGKTWMNMADFMKMYKKKQGNAPQKNYTNQEEFLKDLKKLAKCLKIREGSKLKPEKFFRGLLPEYPAEPGYLEKKYGCFPKNSPSKTEESPKGEPEMVFEESQNSSSSYCSDETVIFRPLFILPESEELSDSN